MLSLAKNSLSKASSVSVRSALNPLLWLCALISLPAWTGACCVEDSLLRMFFLFIGALPVAVVCGIAVFFAIKDPGRLQSEDYQLREHSLQIIAQKSDKALLDPISLQLIANPYIPDNRPLGGSDTEP